MRIAVVVVNSIHSGLPLCHRATRCESALCDGRCMVRMRVDEQTLLVCHCHSTQSRLWPVGCTVPTAQCTCSQPLTALLCSAGAIQLCTCCSSCLSHSQTQCYPLRFSSRCVMFSRTSRQTHTPPHLPTIQRTASTATTHYHTTIIRYIRSHPLTSFAVALTTLTLSLLLCQPFYNALSNLSARPLVPAAPSSPNHAVSETQYPSSNYDRPVSSFSEPLTITTAYYPFPSKHPSNDYHQWLSNLLSHNPTPTVIYTTAAFYGQMAAIRFRELFVNCEPAQFTADTINSLHRVACPLRPNRSLSHFPTRFELSYSSPLDLPITALYSAHWEAQLAIDPERAKHSPTLYATWSAKAYLVNRTATSNPFHSKYFAWMDAGQFRNASKPWQSAVDADKLAVAFGETQETITGHPPSRTYDSSRHMHPSMAAVQSRQHKLLVSLVHPLPASYCASFDPFVTLPVTLLSDHTAGQSFLGTASAIHWYAALYYRLLLSYQSRGAVWGKDQNVANGVTFGYKGSMLLLGAWKVADRAECVVGRGWDAHWSWMGEWLQQRTERKDGCPDELYAVKGMVVEGQAMCDGTHADWLRQSEEEASRVQGPPTLVAKAEAEQTKSRSTDVA